MVKKRFISLAILSSVSSPLVFGCNFSPTYSNIVSLLPINQSVELIKQKDIQNLLVTTWDYSMPLLNEKKEEFDVDNCSNLISKYQHSSPLSQMDKAWVDAVYLNCKLVEASLSLTSSEQTFISGLKLDKNFPSLAPSEFLLSISDESQAKITASKTWSDVTKITDVNVIDSNTTEYRDNVGSIQRMSIVWKGDFNHDGFEDALIYASNSVSGGSYQNQIGYVITRKSNNDKYSIIKTF
ncbi:hypothetical protein HC752_01840 [Vibrio sp. S9_S30]|uniref:hypothetical protein n=1 Tax=Vibrio sp. S9_S30 TaxID=2720226 RepID=UPI001681B73B|nr:hypothetical protein [Vibrio sp. S9_S30]MBD1555676.1 hypothetical protein [Vibrio sp. S9_S30]